jgi:hypothetical protein
LHGELELCHAAIVWRCDSGLCSFSVVARKVVHMQTMWRKLQSTEGSTGCIFFDRHEQVAVTLGAFVAVTCIGD